VPLPAERYAALTVTPQQQKEKTLDALVAWLAAEAERQPVLAAWEDLHWADPSTLELLGLYIDQAPTAPLFHLLTFRPEFVPPWPTRSHMTPLTLTLLEKTGERYYEAELHRQRGELLLLRDAKSHPAQGNGEQHEAETCFQHALDVARQQQAKSLELRAAISLSRLW
jgi:predicted ATPase